MTRPSPEALALLDAAPCGLMRTGDDGMFLRANRTFCTWVGMSPAMLVGKRRFQDLLTMGGRLFHQTHWSPLLRMQGSISEVKLELKHADGTSLPMILNAIRHEEDGVMVHDLAAYVARDRDRYERELVHSRQRLEALVEEANRLHAEAKDRALFAEQMIGIVSHDMRNPLSTVIMGISLLHSESLSPLQQRTVARIQRAAQRASRLTADLLDFTQLRVGRGLTLVTAPMDIHAVVADTLDELRLAYPESRFEHERVGDDTCLGDASRIGQLLGNLVSNAVAYGDPRHPITVRSAGDPSTVTVSVHNAGAPIPTAIAASLFQPMTRGTKAGAQVRSVGLGLFIVREIARAHGGDASVTSTAETGTTFVVQFPAHRPDVDP